MTNKPTMRKMRILVFSVLKSRFSCDYILPEYQWEYPGADMRCWRSKYKHLQSPELQARQAPSKCQERHLCSPSSSEADRIQGRPGPARPPALWGSPCQQVRIIATPWLHHCSTAITPVSQIYNFSSPTAGTPGHWDVSQKMILDSVS